MKQLFQKFPKILLIDATYNVNGVGMPLLSDDRGWFWTRQSCAICCNN